MIARLRVLLPFEFSIPQGATLAPQELDISPYKIRTYPPRLAATDPVAASAAHTPELEIARSIAPATVQQAGRVVVNGQPTVSSNLFQVDFIKPEFDRRQLVDPADPLRMVDYRDPSTSFVFAVMNNWINRYKYLSRSSHVRAIRPGETFWALEFLTDDETELPVIPGLFRFRTSGSKTVNLAVLDAAIWDRVGAIPFEKEALAWEVLLLDAPAMLPKVGPAVVLAYAALEAFIDWSLDKLATASAIPTILWEWINTRDSFWLRPRTAEQFDVMLESLTGRSLKSEIALWGIFRNLSTARHTYVHEGRSRIGNDEVTIERATTLVTGAANIIAWIEALLPENLRRSELETRYEIQIQNVFVFPKPKPSAGSEGNSGATPVGLAEDENPRV
jgi:hypothetical protein